MTSAVGIHARLKKLEPMFVTMDLVMEASRVGYRRSQAKLRSRGCSYLTRRPGFETPMWNILTRHIRRATRPYGTKARLARYLGLPRQRLTDYLTSGRRLPDAEITLRLLHWFEMMKRGRDVSM